MRARQGFLCTLAALFVCLALGSLATTGAVAATAADEHQYYYSDGKKIELVPAPWIAARFTTDKPPDLMTRVPDLRPIEIRELPIQGLTLYRLRHDVKASTRSSLVLAFEGLAEAELVAPVFESSGALVIVTDTFLAQFAPNASSEAIEELHAQQGVEVIGRVSWSPRTYTLKVRGRDCLETANRYHESPLVEFAHPDFVQVMDRAPLPSRLPDERRVYLDGELQPSDIQIEKGTSHYLVTEPASIRLDPGPEISRQSDPSAPVAHTTIKSEGFEGAFPNTWDLSGSPTWDDETYRPYTGSWSGYAVGSTVAPPGPYPSWATSHMTYGPFSLADADDARLTVQAWVRCESGFDFLGIFASADGTQFYGWSWSGDWASVHGGDGWMNIQFDLTRVPTIGDLRGDSSVWISLGFIADGSVEFEGVYVDDIVIEKITGGYESLTNDQYDHLQWSLSNNGQLWGVEGADISAVDAWGVTHGSDAISIAVIDEGVDLSHPDLASKLVPGYDATGGGSAGDATGDEAHGTGCAGIAAALTNNSTGVAGIARATKIMPVRIFVGGSTTTAWEADGINWAVTNGADVLSNSWGGGTPTSLVNNAITNAKTNGRGGKGAVVVFAAGNSNSAVAWPADLSTTLAVGALSPCDQRKAPTSCDGEEWWGSNFGTDLDIMAPGVHMYTTDISGSAGYSSGSYFYNFNGTSSAAPVVSGVAALVLGVNPDLTATQVENILTSSADNLGPAGWDSETGWGRVNAHEAVLATPPAAVDLAAVDVYFRDQPGGAGSIVTNPALGAEVYPHFEFDITSSSSITGTLTEIELDSGTLCTWNGTLDAGPWLTWCPTAWTATAGAHELQGRVDPNDDFDETDENNNDTKRDYTIDPGPDIFADGFESGDTSAWSNTVQ